MKNIKKPMYIAIIFTIAIPSYIYWASLSALLYNTNIKGTEFHSWNMEVVDDWSAGLRIYTFKKPYNEFFSKNKNEWSECSSFNKYIVAGVNNYTEFNLSNGKPYKYLSEKISNNYKVYIEIDDALVFLHIYPDMGGAVSIDYFCK